jgi:hypothetical protein
LLSRKRGSRNTSGMTVAAERCAAFAKVSLSQEHGSAEVDHTPVRARGGRSGRCHARRARMFPA